MDTFRKELKHGILSESLWDNSEERTYVSMTQDAEPILDANKVDRNEFKGFKSNAFNLVARIPTVLYYEWLKQGFDACDCEPGELDRWIASKDCEFVKTIPGRI